ncbi:hypothetical protein GmHk_04G010198 [Glycine max]|nr:hypothetical protein GmHk_04G010198 [Glycine max]
MNEDNREEPDMFENIDCCDAFNTSKVFATRDDVLHWAHSVAYNIGFVAMIMRSNTNNGKRERTSYRSGKYKTYKKDLVRTVIGSRKCGCPFKLRGKLMLGGEKWMVNLICRSHNHALAKSFGGHPYVSQLTLKEHNANSSTTMKQVCNATYAYHSSIRDNNSKMQQLMKLIEHDECIH